MANCWRADYRCRDKVFGVREFSQGRDVSWMRASRAALMHLASMPSIKTLRAVGRATRASRRARVAARAGQRRRRLTELAEPTFVGGTESPARRLGTRAPASCRNTPIDGSDMVWRLSPGWGRWTNLPGSSGAAIRLYGPFS